MVMLDIWFSMLALIGGCTFRQQQEPVLGEKLGVVTLVVRQFTLPRSSDDSHVGIQVWDCHSCQISLILSLLPFKVY